MKKLIVRSTLSRENGGFTLVELLVVIAIIGILVGLLLPAVQMAREAARRMQCTNNLKQVVLAFHNYADSYHGFPNRQSFTTTPNTGHGWGLKLLPYVEQRALYDNFDLSKSFFESENQAITSTPVDTYLCPSSPSGPRTMDIGPAGQSATSTGVAGDYVVFHQIQDTGSGISCSTCNTAAPKIVNTVTKLAEITDGLSNTILVAEEAGRPDFYIGSEKQASNSSMTNPTFWGCWASFQSVTARGSNASVPPGAGGNYTMNRSNTQGVYSFHPGGAMFGLCDGSVRFISETTALSILISLSSRDGGETIAAY
ncbi:DUF1559 domain-containing protein [Bremerella sp. JC817]|uniref:DUF1559 domain-containing protein n=1 Tax=Bremerella sp. JC817 TaxID=3231756 RepID=UPI003459D274